MDRLPSNPDGHLQAEWLTKNTRRVPIDSLAEWLFGYRPEADGTEKYRRMAASRKPRRTARATGA